MTNAIFTGLMLGGMYALIAMGLTLQYGVARIMNLSYGEFYGVGPSGNEGARAPVVPKPAWKAQ